MEFAPIDSGQNARIHFAILMHQMVQNVFSYP